MPSATAVPWIRIGVWSLPVYAVLTFWATFTHEPDRQPKWKPTLGTSAQPTT